MPAAADLAPFLASSDVIDAASPEVRDRARALAATARPRYARRGLHLSCEGPSTVARACFEWVRDHVLHSRDHRLDPLTCSASEVLRHGTGYCFAKAHLLVALLRANGIPAGLAYQRLSRDDDGPPFSLHGFVAVHLPAYGWYRIDPRGNRPGVDAQFTPPIERLAFAPRLPGEADIPGVWSEPLPEVVAALRRHATQEGFWNDLPDREPPFPEGG